MFREDSRVEAVEELVKRLYRQVGGSREGFVGGEQVGDGRVSQRKGYEQCEEGKG